VVDVIDALRPLAQPELLETKEQQADLISTRGGKPMITGAVVAPIGKKTRRTRQ
jgi:hypothetical protein